MIRVLIADDHRLVREGLRRLLGDEPGIEVMDDAADGIALLDQITRVAPDVILLDIGMPGPGVLDLLRSIHTQRPSARVIVLSMYPEEEYAPRVLAAGAAGYLTKDQTGDQLIAAIRHAFGGGTYITASVGEVLANRLKKPATERADHEQLSDREMQVLRLLAKGNSAKKIAATLSVSPKTISTYRARILQKLVLTSTADLVRYAITHDLIDR